jgi:hypothetical protein
MMNKLKQYAGYLWMLVGIASIGLLLWQAIVKIEAKPTQDVIIPWLIIVLVFTPVAIGLVIFGKYAAQGEFSDEKK